MLQKLSRTRALLSLALVICSSCEGLPPLQLESSMYRIHAAQEEDARTLASDMEEFEPRVQEILGIDVKQQHVLVVLPTAFTEFGSNGGTSRSGQMQFPSSAFGHPTESIVPHELVHAHFARSGLPRIPAYLEEGVAYTVGDLIFGRDTEERIREMRSDYSILRPSHLDRSHSSFLRMERGLHRQAQYLGYEIVYRLGISEVLRLGRNGVDALEYIRLADLGIGENAPPPRNPGKPVVYEYEIPAVSSHP